MKSIKEPVSFKAMKHAGRMIFIITSINLFLTIEADKECWQATCFHIIRESGDFFKLGISYYDFYFSRLQNIIIGVRDAPEFIWYATILNNHF